MKLPQILATLTQEPLVITPSTHASLVRMFDEHRSGDRAAREGVGSCGEEVELAQAEIDEDGIMHIPVNGPIGIGLGKFEKGAGAIDVSDVAEEIDRAEEDPRCKGIIFHFDSPGGMYSGTPELGDKIANCDKMTAAFIPGSCCSGAYWLAAACDVIAATKSADVANVGVYCYMLDVTERYKANGVKAEIVSSGDYKGMGAPGVPITAAQRAHLQDRVNEMAETFYDHVQASRPDVLRADMQGQCFKAPSAMARGFVDMIVADVSEVAALF